MKKMNKFVLGLAFTSIIVGSFGTAFALYKNTTNASDMSIGIGTVQSHTESTDNVTYKIGTTEMYSNEALTTKIESNAKLSPDLNKVYVKVPLSFEYGETKTTSKQDTALGRFKVKVEINESIAKKGATVGASLKGYSKATVDNAEYDTYFTKNKMSDFFATTYSETTTSVEKHIDTAVDASNIYCVITIDLSTALSESNFYDVAEISNAFTVTLNWGGYDSSYTDFDSNLVPTAYIRGDLSDWKNLEDYQMVPNINAAYDIVEWKYKLLKGFSKIKVYDSSETQLSTNGWIPCRGVDKDSGATKETDGNATLDKEKSYDIYYTRNETYTDKQGFYVAAGSESKTETN
jgi:hypothetical protein